MDAMLNFLIVLGVFMLIGTSVRLWVWVYMRRQSGHPILEPLVPLPWVRWGLIDLGLLTILIIGLQLVVASFMSQLPVPEQVIRLDQVRDEALENRDDPSRLLPGSHRPHARNGEEIEGPVDFAEAAELATGSELGKQHRLLASMVVANLAWVLLGLAGLRYWRGIPFQELGFDRRRLLEDVRLGVAAFCMLAPPVYLIQLVLVQLWPSEHPLVEMIREDESGRLLWLGGIAAVIVAPLFEELAFRLFLQGWLENLVRVVDQEPLPTTEFDAPDAYAPDERYWQLLVHGWSPAPGKSDRETTHDPQANWHAAISVASGFRENVDRAFDREHPSIPGTPSNQNTNPPYESGRLLLVPILASSLIFALLHYNHGPDWVPLLLLAIGLGYLYQRTRRILPCVVVHLLLNLTSYGMLMLDMASGS